MVHILLAASIMSLSSETAELKLCDPTKYVSKIEPDMQYAEKDFTYERFRLAIDWLNEANWKTRVEGKTYSEPFELGWEFEMAYFNRLTVIEGYALKQKALAATGEEKAPAIEEFCTFVINAVPLD